MAKRKKEKMVTITLEYLQLLWLQIDEYRARIIAGK